MITLRKFFMGRALVLSILLILAGIVWGYKSYFSNTEEVVPSAASTFTWNFEKSDSLNLDGIPNTNIFLEIKYLDGMMENKLVDTTPSSCNELPDSSTDSVPNSTDIQCYGAGLGYHFKITQGTNSYLVQRKKFEEELPDQKPPVYEYEVVAEFPLTK
ncbi:MAG: hypothetical protein KBC06_02450 [Candidatus Pacebacteria bacterium]|nr:hypothetical protein [Candidatus Paceibacterota bacterium]